MIIWILLAAALLVALFRRYPYFIQDVRFLRDRIKARDLVMKYLQTNYTILDRFGEVVKAHPHKPFLRFKDETYSFQDADELSNKAARVFLQIGVKEGDKVALFLRNEPMFLWMWLGLVKIGCAGAFLNYNIRSKSLLHCFSCVGAKTLVATEELQDAVDEVLPTLLEQGITVLTLADRSKNAHVQSFKEKMNQALLGPLPKGLRSQGSIRSPAAYIYTSGTTGLPKAAEISHTRLWLIVGFMSSVGMTAKDVIYVSLPLYHTAGFIGVMSALDIGMTVVLRDKFSASNFWDDCRKYNVTAFQYIGEIMRYLCNTPKKLNDRSHKVRLAIGNGLRADVWKDFLDRFGNIKIKEFYGATEGNFGLVNYVDKIGAVGRHFYYFKKTFPYAVIKFDVETATPVRDSSGFCIEVDKGEPGLLVTEISPHAPFVGYVGDLHQTERKKLRDVFKKGDLYFNSGDLLRIDEENFFYFQDRVGDTFRWKGENVATTEVADILAMADCIKEANVYGVKVPGQEGRCGMAAVTLKEGQTFDSAAVCKQAENFLPGYARPRFLRVQSSMDVTGTYKHLKAKLVEEGFNPNKITEPLFYLDEKVRDYVPLTLDIFNAVTSGKIKF